MEETGPAEAGAFMPYNNLPNPCHCPQGIWDKSQCKERLAINARYCGLFATQKVIV